jgi:hypothetical protein
LAIVLSVLFRLVIALSVLFRLAIVLSVRFRFNASDYLFGIFMFFFDRPTPHRGVMVSVLASSTGLTPTQQLFSSTSWRLVGFVLYILTETTVRG